jgi:hypothetical protein
MPLPNRLNCLVHKPRENADMKRITSSVGLVALGAASLQAAYAPGLSQMETSKPWTVSAAVHGFYDDNYATAPSASKRSSYGFDVSPKLGLNLAMDQTLIRVSYEYSAKFFEDRASDKWDQSHVLDATLDHAFSQRYSLTLHENFSKSQEPDIFFGAIPLRSNTDNIHNRASAAFNGALTRVMGYEVSYQNDIYRYDDATRSLQLDRIEHDMMGRLTWLLQEETILSAGGKYRLIRYDNGDLLQRDADIFYGFAGVDHQMSAQFSASARFGFYYTDYKAGGSSTVNPYADISVTYTYAELSSLQLGFRLDRNQTDVSGTAVALATLGQNTTGGYLQWNHQLAPRLSAVGSLVATSSQYDSRNAAVDGTSDLVGAVSVGLNYMISEHFSTDAGYSYTRLSSELDGRSYSRNRVYVGVSAKF